ncbi:Glycosyl transferases group 1 [Tistlia consotensis]|uniref:Glycosyl transferases group 1 n=1 Tax=Tistlia consotensis USBA 355 TaxID=560819 RepID=A0A1Y6CLS4_9PROT|nr:glycosyltransferase family 4 protein [Tistlia consotensis]SMF63131.1 Glycosyl transferases group 1 [Tistlia consotensis USBA 355]SNR95613.1 Glycosyl transferases group 1 [Tistlia consotensis]
MTAPQVVVSHPARQGFVYRLPLAAQLAGLETRFLTGLYYRPDRWPWRWLARRPGLAATLARRRQPGLDDRVVVSVSGPLPELAYRLQGSPLLGDALHDRLAARWLARHLPAGALFHGAVNSCRDSLAVARKRGAATLLEVTAPPWREALLAAEAERLGQPARPAEPSSRMRAELELADRIVVQAPQVVEFLAAHGVPRGRMVLLPLGVDLERFRPATGAGGAGTAGGAGLRVVSVGRPSLDKGTPLLLEAWRRAALPDGELLLVGPTGDPLAERLLADAPPGVTALGVLGHDRLTGLLGGADLFVLSSPIEGGPMAVLEALACGLPCLLTEGCRSVVRDGLEGRVVPSGDPDALAAALRALAADRAGLAALRPAARRRAEAFGWADHARRLGWLYRELLAGALPAGAEPLDLTGR